MALIKCPECGKEMSSDAAACPQCGKPQIAFLPQKKSSPLAFGCLILILLGIGYCVYEADQTLEQQPLK